LTKEEIDEEDGLDVVDIVNVVDDIVGEK